MKIIDCEFHYYLPELMDYLATRDEAMRYYPEKKVLEVRDKIYAQFSAVTNTYPVIDELMNFGAERVAEMDRNGIDIAVLSSSPALEELPERSASISLENPTTPWRNSSGNSPAASWALRFCRHPMSMRPSRNWSVASKN